MTRIVGSATLLASGITRACTRPRVRFAHSAVGDAPSRYAVRQTAIQVEGH